MSLEMMVWALKKDLKNSDFKAMIYIANEADSSGICYTGQEKLAAKSGLGLRTLQGSISRLRKMDLLHTERRPAEFARGRKVDAIILHPQNADWELPQQLQEAEEIREFRRLRDAYEVIEEPVDNSVSDLPADSAGRYEKPSQTQGAKIAGKSFNPQKADVQPAKMSRSTRKNKQPAFNRNARAFNPINPVNPSSTPVLNSTQEPAVENERMDGGKTSSEEAPRNPQVAELRRSINRQGINHQYTDVELFDVLEMLTKRYTAVGREVSSPVGLMISAIRNEPGGLDALVLQAKELQHMQQAQAAPAVAKPAWCSMHNREYTSPACPVCSNPRLVALEQAQTASLPVISQPASSNSGAVGHLRQNAQKHSQRQLLTEPPLKQRV